MPNCMARLVHEALDAGAIDRAAIQTDMSALGRFLITKKESDIASFETPGQPARRRPSALC